MGRTKDFFIDMRQGEEYANLNVNLEVYNHIRKEFEEEEDYKLNFIKQKNDAYKEDETLKVLYKDYSKIKKEIIKREQEINHGR